VPDHLDQFVLAHDPVAVADQMHEQVKHLRLDMNNRAAAPQLPPRNVDFEVSEAEVQSFPHLQGECFASAG
jgi:hypothetical protein